MFEIINKKIPFLYNLKYKNNFILNEYIKYKIRYK